MPQKLFTILFTCIVLAELICNYNSAFSQFSLITKPAIVSSLIIYFLIASSSLNKSIRNLMVLALIGSLIGDILLLFVHKSSNFFIAGLVAFLIAHIMYSIVFLKHLDPLKKPYMFIGLLLTYSSVLFYILKDGLGEMLIPVVIYIAAILTMATTAFLRKGDLKKASYLWVFLGAIIFMLSDSIIAIDKFHKPFALSGVSIMLTYSIAQYLIVMGILKQKLE